MIQYAGRRLLGAIPVLWGVATLVFVLLRLLPGDPAEVMLSEAGGSAAAIAELRALCAGSDHRAIKTGIDAFARTTDEFAARRMDKSIRSALAGHKVDELEL